MPKASDLKKGAVVEYKSQLCIVKNIDVQSPSSRGASTLYKVRFATVPAKQKLEERFKGDDQLTPVELIHRRVVFSYMEDSNFIFMDEESYDQYSLQADQLEDDALYITESLQGALALIVDEQVIGLELPATVEMTVSETTPGIKGASASARTKPAYFETGLVIQVPEYLDQGERVKINTAENKFISRA
jgi:elongation factor P